VKESAATKSHYLEAYSKVDCNFNSTMVVDESDNIDSDFTRPAKDEEMLEVLERIEKRVQFKFYCRYLYERGLLNGEDK
jgi:hypothetical protein